MNILITGATSFIGKHLCNTLAERYPEYNYMGLCNHMPEHKDGVSEKVDLRYCPIYTVNTTHAILAKFTPDFIFHLASLSKPNFVNSYKMWETNALGTMLLINSLRKPCPVVFTSTANIWNSGKELITTHYAASKRAAEDILDLAVTEQKITCSNVLRLCGVVGSGMTHGLLADIVSKVKNDSNTITVGPNTSKKYLHIEDVVDILAGEIHYQATGSFLRTICPHDQLSTNEVVNIGLDVFGKNKEIINNESLDYIGNIRNHNPENDYGRIYKRKYSTSKDAVRKAFESYV